MTGRMTRFVIRGFGWVVVAVTGLCAAILAVGVTGTAVVKRNKELGLKLIKPYSATTRLFAGRRLSPLAVIEHQGRRSGRTYTTPLASFRYRDGLLFPLPYGAGTDWCRNVLASGYAVVVRNGQRHRLEHPEVIDLDAAALRSLPPLLRHMTRREADQGLWLRHTDIAPNPTN